MDSIKLYTIKPAYIDYLIPHAPHLFHNKAAGQHNERKYIGIVLHVGDMDYFAPLSSFKEKHKTMKEVDVDALKTEQEQLKVKLRQTSGAKNKLTQMLDQLDVTDKHYNRKYQDMQDRLDNLYDKVDAIERSMKDVNERIQGAQNRQISAKQICTILSEFDKLYDQMTDMEKKEFMQSFIRSIELYPEGEGKGGIIRTACFLLLFIICRSVIRFEFHDVAGLTVQIGAYFINRFRGDGFISSHLCQGGAADNFLVFQILLGDILPVHFIP